MRKSYLTTLLSVGVALASLSSCSRSSYSFNAAPAYLGSERVHASAAAPEAEITASTEAAAPVAVEAPAKAAATALARPRAASVAPKAAVAAAPAVASATFTKVERKELKQALRQAAQQKKATSPAGTSADGKSQIIATILCFFLGGLGIHRFYLGYTGIGILMLLTFGLFGILTLIDFVRIIIGDLKPKDGDYTTKF